ncbi:MAG: 50S ribosomal protein L10 [Bacteroidia bacterium]|nr:50S ribosomal protein L10 [Bacteroidia bacterium]MCF8425235.1 50S ribosomal protein L10 [Bacteroidia bacterium]MCF8446441.1 50S ribosomal protein L10 [Bacteroidia bacterium]
MKKEEKELVIDALVEKFNQYKNIYVTDISSLNAQKTSELRRLLFKSNITLEVAKNTLIQKAFEKSSRDFGSLTDTLKGNSALMFCEDMKAPAKAIKDFRKKATIPTLKGAVIDADVFIGDNQLETLLTLKTKNELIGEIIGLLQSPAQNVISALQSGGNTIAGVVKTLSERPE